ncbi:MAG: reductive dehalogenase [Albidovulum sp.]|nr:reductive dehalogenase [Albidovulum sp.]
MKRRLFSNRRRPVHLGSYPTETLRRDSNVPQLASVPPMRVVDFGIGASNSIIGAMGEYQTMMDAIQSGLVNAQKASVPADPDERANHLKAFGYFSDASLVGICKLHDDAKLKKPVKNENIPRLIESLKQVNSESLAAGIEEIMADLEDTVELPQGTGHDHSHAIVVLYEHFRDPSKSEPGSEWIIGAQDQRAAIRANETAVVLANYIRLLGYDAMAHSPSNTHFDLNKLAVLAGVACVSDGRMDAPFIGPNFGLAAVTCTLDMTADEALAAMSQQKDAASRPGRDPYKDRNYAAGSYPFEALKRVETPTTYIDEDRVARIPMRADMFTRAQFGDMGKANQDNAAGGYYVSKAPSSLAQLRVLGALVALQSGGENPHGPCPSDSQRNAENVKAAGYFLGIDAVGISRCPDWVWYSHNAAGEPINPPHDNAITMIIDQGFETMDGSSGDDWIALSQSMRAYLRFSLLGGIISQHIRDLGYSAKAHTVMDSEVLQPPLVLLSGLGEVSRIGEVILNPFMGPRLKTGVITTDMPLVHDKPIDFGLQNFCNNCNKCARECPSGAITAGPKLMYNGYEIWKSDSQKCTTYRVTQAGGAMCGRCMKTCPWNLEGLFSEAPFRWAAMNIPAAAPLLAKLDDAANNGGLNVVKKWWWDLELKEDGGFREPAQPVNRRDLQKDIDLKYEDQTLAVYPATLAPHPYPYPFPMDREAGIEAYQAMVTVEEYHERIAQGDTSHVHTYRADAVAPVIQVEIVRAEKMTDGVTKFEFASVDGSELPPWTAGAHLDIVVAPEFLRQYSISGNPSDRSRYQIGVLREDEGRGGSRMLHRLFREGRKIFVSHPINHFELVEDAKKTFLMAGGIGITPMIAFGHRLHELGAEFELHYSASRQDGAGFLDDLAKFPWADWVSLHFSDQGTRADLDQILSGYVDGYHVYTCGPDRFMESVMDAAERNGYPEEARHLEYFSVPEQPEYENHDFVLRLTKSGKELAVPADKAATEVLLESGIKIDVKCSDGLCGVCKCRLISGNVEHRDFVLSKKQREDTIILCQSRAAEKDGIVEIDL